MKAEAGTRTSKRNHLKNELPISDIAAKFSQTQLASSSKSSDSYSLDERLEKKRRERELAKASSNSPAPESPTPATIGEATAPTTPTTPLVAKRWGEKADSGAKAANVLGS